MFIQQEMRKTDLQLFSYVLQVKFLNFFLQNQKLITISLLLDGSKLPQSAFLRENECRVMNKCLPVSLFSSKVIDEWTLN